MRSPRSIDIDITARCNARCLYCYHFDDAGGDCEDLPTSEWLTFFGELGRLGVMSVTLAGGEPFIRDDLPELVDGIVANRMRFAILSNGALLTDDMALYLKQTGRCDYVQISVDGSCAAVHDAARGAGSFDGAMRALDILRRHGVQPAVRVTVHRLNIDDLQATVEMLLDDLEIEAIGTNSAGYLGSCRRYANDLLLTTAERQAAMETLVALSARYPGRIQASAGPLAEAVMWQSMEQARRAGAPPFPNGGRLTACGCPTHKLAVRADGVVTVCNLLPTLELGHINRDDLLGIWQTHPTLQAHRDRSRTSLSDFSFCSGCDWIDYCTGNCPATALTHTGRVDAPNPESCLREYLRDGGRLVPMHEMSRP